MPTENGGFDVIDDIKSHLASQQSNNLNNLINKELLPIDMLKVCDKRR